MTGAIGPAAGRRSGPSPLSVAIRAARRWPYATASVIAVAIWFATNAILAPLIPAPSPVSGIVGYLAGVVVGTPLAGLKGARGWAVVPVITLGLAAVVFGILALSGVDMP